MNIINWITVVCVSLLNQVSGCVGVLNGKQKTSNKQMCRRGESERISVDWGCSYALRTPGPRYSRLTLMALQASPAWHLQETARTEWEGRHTINALCKKGFREFS